MWLHLSVVKKRSLTNTVPRHLLSTTGWEVWFCLDWEVSSCDMLSCCLSDPVTTCLLLYKISFVSLSWMWIPSHGESKSDIMAHWNSGKHSLSLHFLVFWDEHCWWPAFSGCSLILTIESVITSLFLQFKTSCLDKVLSLVLTLWLQFIEMVHDFSNC